MRVALETRVCKAASNASRPVERKSRAGKEGTQTFVFGVSCLRFLMSNEMNSCIAEGLFGSK